MDNLPLSIQNLIQRAIEELSPDQILLFGSRARGTARKVSDFDLAFVLTEKGKQQWGRFLLAVEEKPYTLFPTDLVAWHEAPNTLKEQIKEEGIVLYERH